MNKKMKIVVIGGSGLIGRKLVNNLRQRGHEVVAGSPSTGVNTITGEGFSDTLAGAEVVVDVANAPVWEDKAVLEFFETSGRNLLAAEAVAPGEAPCSQLIWAGNGRCFRARAVISATPWFSNKE